MVLLREQKKKRISYQQTGLFALCFLLSSIYLSATNHFCFRVYLKDKGASSYSVASAEEFLSPESIEKRLLWETFVDETDFPISQAYIDELTATGVRMVVRSKWMKTVVVESADSLVADQLRTIPFVDSVACVWKGEERIDTTPCPEDHTTRFESGDVVDKEEYGGAKGPLEMLNGIRLHATGHRGKKMRIAVVDAGFLHVDRIEAFAGMDLLGTYNVPFPERSVFCEDDHGTKVLSCLAANQQGVMIGSAPEASYLLIKSEDTRAEYPIEEDYWAAAVEYADSVGVDIITSSLGYFKYDNMPDYYTPDQLDGQTAFISRMAAIAAGKGILLVFSAGNEGSGEWEKITFPADVENVLTVGSITSDGGKSAFSPVGMTADYRIKPDVVAQGTDVCVIGSSGQTGSMNGTSFSAPLVAGLAACLWQAFPLLKNTELIALIKETAGQHQQPDAQLGYGIPDMFNAYTKANSDALR
jgi:subtilisin family serine protease